jgi:hypothetical protein
MTIPVVAANAMLTPAAFTAKPPPAIAARPRNAASVRVLELFQMPTCESKVAPVL